MKTRLMALWMIATFLFSGCGGGQSSTPAENPPTERPHTQTAVTDTRTAMTPSLTASPQALADWLQEFSTHTTELGEGGDFSGSLLFTRDEEVLWASAYGMADQARNLPNLVETKFNLASMNKMFTAVAILQLMEAGKLNLEDSISQHLPDYPNPEVGSQVTITQLLTHTSGLGDVFTEEYDENPHQYGTNADFLSLFVNDDLLFEPGEAFSYSNAGFVVLGLIIEAVSGQGYEQYVQENIFEPAGMDNTGAFDVEAVVPNLAVGYTNESGTLTSNTAILPGRGFAGGGGYSTVEDLFRFRNALLNFELLSEATTQQAMTGQVEMGEITDYGLGFMERNLNGQRVAGHTGGFPGICSFLYMYLDSGYTVIVLSNSDEGCIPFLEYLKEHSLAGVE